MFRWQKYDDAKAAVGHENCNDDEKLFNLNLDKNYFSLKSKNKKIEGCIIKLCDSFMPILYTMTVVGGEIEIKKRSGSKKYFDLIKMAHHNIIVKLFFRIFLIISRSS